MKKTLLFIIAFIIAKSFATSAQNCTHPNFSTIKKMGQWLPDTVYFFSHGSGIETYVDRTIFQYEHSPQGLIVEETFQFGAYGSWGTYVIDTYTYDLNNNLLTLLRQSASRKNVQLYTYTYDSNYNLITEANYMWINDSWVDGYKTGNNTYTYDSNNKILTRLLNGSILITYIYDSNNNLINDGQYTYTYDSNNSLITKQLGNNELYTYTYDSKNNLLTETHQRRINDSWVNEKQYIMSYDDNNNGILVESLIWIDGLWVPTHNYGLNNYATSVIYYNNMNNNCYGWSGCDKMTASYVKISDNTGKEEIKTESPIQIFSSGKTIHINNQTGKNAEIGVYRIDGVKVAEQTMVGQITTIEIPVSGFYLVSVRAGNEKPVMEKIIIR